MKEQKSHAVNITKPDNATVKPKTAKTAFKASFLFISKSYCFQKMRGENENWPALVAGQELEKSFRQFQNVFIRIGFPTEPVQRHLQSDTSKLTVLLVDTAHFPLSFSECFAAFFFSRFM